MDNKTFDALCMARFAAVDSVLLAKGREYSGLGDRLANFKRGAADTGVQPSSVLWIYLSKHLDSIRTFIGDIQTMNGQIFAVETKLSEPIEGRIMDAIAYLLLLEAMVVELRQNQQHIDDSCPQVDLNG